MTLSKTAFTIMAHSIMYEIEALGTHGIQHYDTNVTKHNAIMLSVIIPSVLALFNLPQKSFFVLQFCCTFMHTGANVVKLFTTVIYYFSYKARAFLVGKLFRPSLMFVGKAWGRLL